jgi:hypothetical protein
MGIAAVRFEGEQQVFHTYATWNGWSFDHSGWNPETELLAVNTDFEGRLLERVEIVVSFDDFCEQHYHRMPHQYWRDPMQRAREYVDRHQPPVRSFREALRIRGSRECRAPREPPLDVAYQDDGQTRG